MRRVRSSRRRSVRAQIEQLDSRILPAVTAVFNAGVLTITGNQKDDTVRVVRQADGALDVFQKADIYSNLGGKKVAIAGGTPTVDSTDHIEVALNDGDDILIIDMTAGPFSPGATTEGTGDSEIEFNLTGVGHLRIRGQDGAADFLDFGLNAVNLNADDDVDIVITNSFDMQVHGQGGNDVITGAGGAVVGTAAEVPLYLYGGSGDDQLVGGSRGDILSGGLGNNTLLGGDGADVFAAEGDFNYVVTNAGLTTTDAASATVATDTFNESPEMVLIFAGADANSIDASAFTGDTQLYGLAGNDTLKGGTASDLLIGGTGDDVVEGGAGFNDINGGDGNDILTGGPDDDVLIGGTGNDSLTGDNGDDALQGDAGVDSLFGGAGSDSLAGGKSADQITGNADGDVFSSSDAAAERQDFNAGEGDTVAGLPVLRRAQHTADAPVKTPVTRGSANFGGGDGVIFFDQPIAGNPLTGGIIQFKKLPEFVKHRPLKKTAFKIVIYWDKDNKEKTRTPIPTENIFTSTDDHWTVNVPPHTYDTPGTKTIVIWITIVDSRNFEKFNIQDGKHFENYVKYSEVPINVLPP